MRMAMFMRRLRNNSSFKPSGSLTNHSSSSIIHQQLTLSTISSLPLPSEPSQSFHLPPKLSSFIDLNQAFINSRRSNRPIIALESTILTHGLPKSEAIDLAAELEQIAIRLNVTPVHIALIDGRIKVGLSSDQVQQLLSTPEDRIFKLGRRDLPSAISLKLTGGMTVSATMAISKLLGIRVFATGGIGGVHRGANQTMDISSDLTELSRNPVAVVCSGVKSILDIPLTLEYLETLGVPLISFSDTNEFPAFYSPRSGYEAPFYTSSPLECAEMLYHSDLLGLNSGTLIAVPIPNQFAQSGELIQKAVDQAVVDSVRLGIHTHGKSVTPWLLNRVKELTAGKSVDANVGLVKNNVHVAAQIATDYQNLILISPSRSSSVVPNTQSQQSDKSKNVDYASNLGASRMMVIGAAAIDITSRVLADHRANPLQTGSTTPGSIKLSIGGVALNIARTSHQLGVKDVMLVSELGMDCLLGDYLIKQLHSFGLRSDGLRFNPKSSTGIVNMLLNCDGDLLGGVADLKSAENPNLQVVSSLFRTHKPKVVCFDGNLSSDAISEILKICRESDSIITAFEPTSILKSTNIIKGLVEQFNATNGTKKLSIMFPNLKELNAIHERGVLDSSIQVFESVEYFKSIKNLDADSVFLDNVRKKLPEWVTESGVFQISLKLLPFVDSLLIKNGQHGVVFIASRNSSSQVSNHVNLFPLSKSEKPNSDEKPVHNSWVFNRNRTLCVKHFPAINFNDPQEASLSTIHNNLDFSPYDDSQVKKVDLINVTGAGDSICGSVLSSIVLHNSPNDNCFDWDLVIDSAQRMAIKTLTTDDSVGAL